jgi:tight adherence protein C
MVIILYMLTVCLFLFYVVLKIYEPQLKAKKRIEMFVNVEKSRGKVVEDDKEDEEESFKKIIRLKLKGKIKEYFGEKISSTKEEVLEKKLLQAGNPFGMTYIDYQVLKISMRIFAPALGIIFGKFMGGSIGEIIFLAFLGFMVGFFTPDWYIKQKIKLRYKLALKELPDFLDLLTVCLEAGLGFDLALSKVISKNTGILSTEFHISLEEIRLGKTRKEALSGIKERLEFDEVKSLINNILQAEKLGISIVQVLRIKSAEEREKRKQRAEEEAMKAPIKILFPLVLFIFPSIFIVLLGPAVIQLMNGFGK